MKSKYLLVIIVLMIGALFCAIQIMRYSLERRKAIAEYCTPKSIPLPTFNTDEPTWRRFISNDRGVEYHQFDKLDHDCLKFFK